MIEKYFKVLEHVDYVQYKTRKVKRWLCLCNCGQNFLEVSGHLNRRKSCGCMNFMGENKNVKQIEPKETSWNHLINQYQQNAKKKNIEFSLTRDEIKNLFQSCCHYCGIEPSNVKNAFITKAGRKIRRSKRAELSWIKWNGIDRVDNSKGYSITNCVPCCHTCNNAKRNLTINEFEEWIQRIVSFRSGL